MAPTRPALVRGATVVVTTAFLGVLGYYLGQPGYTETRLAFFAVLAGLAVVGTAGAVYQRDLVAVVCAAGLVLLGFWQAVLWVFILPVAAMLVVAALASATHEPSDALDSG